MATDSISQLNSRKQGYVHIGLTDAERTELTEGASNIFKDVQDGKLDFVTDALASHTMILNSIVEVNLKKATGSDYAREYTQLAIKAMEQARKSGVALAQIKNVILNIENLTIQQNNLIQINTGNESSPIPTPKVVESVVV